MVRSKYIILGAGPAGLTFANQLLNKGINNFIVLEKESVAGGLCRSQIIDGSPLDIGGGHFLDVRRPKVNEFLFEFMPESEWNIFERNSKINVSDCYIDHPFEANIWQFPQDIQVQYLKSIAVAGCNLGKIKPERFVEWIEWKLGNLISKEYMLPYNKKMFGDNLDQLGTYWLEKLPSVSFDETLLSCMNKKAYGSQPGHARFYYPKNFGYGELWLRMANKIHGKMVYDSNVEEIDFDKSSVKSSDGSVYYGENIITTIPWTSIKRFKGMPVEINDLISKLKFTSVNITYYPEDLNSDAHWIYYPDLQLSYHRILLRHNFCMNSKGYWTETNSDRFQNDGKFTYLNDYAYPLNTIDKPDVMKILLTWARSKNVFGLGRWGEWEHYNSDVTVEKAMILAENLTSNE